MEKFRKVVQLPREGRGRVTEGKGGLEYFRAWLNVISFQAVGWCTSGIVERRRDRVNPNSPRVLSLFIENASRILSRLRTVNEGYIASWVPDSRSEFSSGSFSRLPRLRGDFRRDEYAEVRLGTTIHVAGRDTARHLYQTGIILLFGDVDRSRFDSTDFDRRRRAVESRIRRKVAKIWSQAFRRMKVEVTGSGDRNTCSSATIAPRRNCPRNGIR